jgi:phosphoribosylglycinamide formyltransferase-1
LPKYPGAHAIEQAIHNNEKDFGVTIHYVDENMDTGQIIFQKKIVINKINKENIESQIKLIEHKYYPLIINKILG